MSGSPASPTGGQEAAGGTPIGTAIDYSSAGAAKAGGGRKGDEGPEWLRYVAMMTGILAGLAGFLTVRGANLSNEAIYHSNQAVLHQAEASDKWTEYQANSIKAHLAETQLSAGIYKPGADALLQADAKKSRDRQPDLKNDAQKFEADRNAELVLAARLRGEKSHLDYAGMAVQLGIALASVAALTRRFAAFVVGTLAGLAGAAITAAVMVQHYLVKG